MTNDRASFGKYTLCERLAAGTVADIYRAQIRNADGSERELVIKKIRPEFSTDVEFLTHFVDEARVAASLDHPNIARVFEWGRFEDSLFIAMEYLPGTNLAALMQAVAEQGLRFPPTIGIYIVCAVLRGLAYLHDQKDPFGNPLGLVHRDVSPPNVILTADGRVKLIDFGLAKVTSKLHASMPEAFLGKFCYLAPEIVRHQPVDERADLFSLGVVLYEILTGNKLQSRGEEKDLQTIVNIARSRPPSGVYADIPTELDQLLERVLSAEAERRPRTAQLLHDELQNFLVRWDRLVDAVGLAAFLREALSGRVAPEPQKAKVGFAFGEATSQWLAHGEEAGELVRLTFQASQTPAPAAAPAGLESPKERSDETDKITRVPPPRFAPGSTVMAIEEGGLGKRRSRRLILWTLFGLAVAVFAAFWVLKTLHSETAGGAALRAKSLPVPASVAISFAGPVEIKTQPPGAIALVDGAPVTPEGNPPRLLGLRAGDHRFRLMLPGYLPWEGDLKLIADLPLVLEKTLEERRGDVTVTSKPPGAAIFLDGRRSGKTPRVFKGLPATRTYKVVLQLPRYLPERFVIEPSTWPDKPDEPYTIEKELQRAGRKKIR